MKSLNEIREENFYEDCVKVTTCNKCRKEVDKVAFNNLCKDCFTCQDCDKKKNWYDYEGFCWNCLYFLPKIGENLEWFDKNQEN